MDFERIEKFIHQYHRKIIVIRLTGGEPLFYEHFEQVIDLFNNYNIKYALLTNGTLLNESIIEKLIINCIEISISIDSIKETMYARIRKGGDLNQLIRNINLINEKKKKRRAPILNVAMTCFSFNIDELADMIKFCKANNIPTLSAGEGTFYNTSEIKDEHFIKNNKDQAFTAVNEAQKVADELGVTLRLNAPILYYLKEDNLMISNRDPVTSCTDFFFYCILTPELEIKLCPASNKVMKIDDSNMSGFWNSNRLKENRKILGDGGFPDTCRYCKDYNSNISSGMDYSFIGYQKRTKYWKLNDS
jgi:MoaA/NifB/PqqE/SkfB family radical SAM enzyme